MHQSGFRISALRMCALVLGLMAFVTGAAQAEKGAAWMVNGSNITAPLKPGLKVAVENNTLSLLTTVFSIPTKILCKTVSMTGTLGIDGSVSQGRIIFTGCPTYLSGSATPSAPCLPKTAGVNDVIETRDVIGLLVLVGGVGEMLFKSLEEGKPIATIETTEECAIGQKINVTGELLLKDCQGKIKEELVTHLFEADNVNGSLTISGNPATLDGSFNISLSGAHAGLKWSGLPL